MNRHKLSLAIFLSFASTVCVGQDVVVSSSPDQLAGIKKIDQFSVEFKETIRPDDVFDDTKLVAQATEITTVEVPDSELAPILENVELRQLEDGTVVVVEKSKAEDKTTVIAKEETKASDKADVKTEVIAKEESKASDKADVKTEVIAKEESKASDKADVKTEVIAKEEPKVSDKADVKTEVIAKEETKASDKADVQTEVIAKEETKASDKADVKTEVIAKEESKASDKADVKTEVIAKEKSKASDKADVKTEVIAKEEPKASDKADVKTEVIANEEAKATDKADVKTEVIAKEEPKVAEPYHIGAGKGLYHIVKDLYTSDMKEQGVSESQFLAALYRNNSQSFSSKGPMFPYSDTVINIPPIDDMLREDNRTYTDYLSRKGMTLSLNKLPPLKDDPNYSQKLKDATRRKVVTAESNAKEVAKKKAKQDITMNAKL